MTYETFKTKLTMEKFRERDLSVYYLKPLDHFKSLQSENKRHANSLVKFYFKLSFHFVVNMQENVFITTIINIITY